MKRLFGPCVRATRQDVLVAGDVDASSTGDKDIETWVVYGKAKKQSDMKRKVGEGPKMNKDKEEGDGETLNGSNRFTGVRRRCYDFDSKYHLAPKCQSRHLPEVSPFRYSGHS